MENPKPINYAHLARKYVTGAQMTVHDRTYDGLEWHGPGEKPSIEMFRALQREEEREARANGFIQKEEAGLAMERQAQGRARALDAIRPIEDRLREQEEEAYRKTLELKEKALITQSLLRERDRVVDCWQEITEAQDLARKEAQKFLDETASYLSWDPNEVPAEVRAGRIMAHARLRDGETVYADWARLRSDMLPTREEMAEMIRKGGEHLKRLEELCKTAALKYPKPRKNHF